MTMNNAAHTTFSFNERKTGQEEPMILPSQEFPKQYKQRFPAPLVHKMHKSRTAKIRNFWGLPVKNAIARALWRSKRKFAPGTTDSRLFLPERRAPHTGTIVTFIFMGGGRNLLILNQPLWAPILKVNGTYVQLTF